MSIFCCLLFCLIFHKNRLKFTTRDSHIFYDHFFFNKYKWSDKWKDMLFFYSFRIQSWFWIYISFFFHIVFLFRSEILFRTLKQLFFLVVVAWYQVSHTVHAVTVTYHIFSSNMIFWNDHPAILGRIPNKCNINDYNQRQKISSAHSFKGSSINVGTLINREGREQWFSIGVLRNPWVPWKALGVPPTFEVDD